ncbi:hypothetical protein RQP46_008449 [Phenoliferia psychrophenolica]
MSKQTASRTTSRQQSTGPSTTRRAPSTKPGPQADSSVEDDFWVVALLGARGVGREIGVAAALTSVGKVIVTQFADSPSFVKVTHLLTTRPPSVILCPPSFLGASTNPSYAVTGENAAGAQAGDEGTMLVRSLRAAWPDTPIQPVARKFWNEQTGFEFLTQLTVNDEERTGTILAIKSKFYALSALSALFKYLESQALVFPPRSLRISYSPLEGTCLIDGDTAANLELVFNLVSRKSKQHLLGLLNSCYTPMATRLLRTNILGPLTDVTVINTRLDAVEELVGSEERFTAIRKALEPLKKVDVDKLVGQLATSPRPQSLSSTADPSKEAEQKVARALLLRTVLTTLPALRGALQGMEAGLIQTIGKILDDERLDEMLDAIHDTINVDAQAVLQKGSLAAKNVRIYAIKSQKRKLLDVARETYKENLNDAFEMGESLATKFGLDISMTHTQNGFVFSCPNVELDEKPLPKMFIHPVKKGKKTEFTSMDLKKKNARLAESVQEVFLMSNEILDHLFDDIRTDIASLFRAAEAIAMLDMIAAFADVASKNSYVRPEWTETLAISAGRHPLHEQFRLRDGAFVPNDTYASDAASFQIVGKSTLLRQIALLHIMAQIGCYVPATYASFRVVDCILSRLSNEDSIEAGLSTFSREMSQMAMITSSMSSCKQCLLIIDELGRGTSPSDGLAIAHALAEEVIKTKCFCFFATHFKELSMTLSRFPNVVSLHLETDVDVSQADYSLIFHHRVSDGVTPITHYGTSASLCGCLLLANC